MMNVVGLVGAFVAGGIVGLAYFAALWFTVRALPSSTRPARLVLVSYLLRLGMAGAMFVLLVRAGGWPALVSALAGFVIARTVMVRRVRPPDTLLPGDARC